MPTKQYFIDIEILIFIIIPTKQYFKAIFC